MKPDNPKSTERIDETPNPFEAVGELLRSNYSSVMRDTGRPGIWIVPNVNGSSVCAYIPFW